MKESIIYTEVEQHAGKLTNFKLEGNTLECVCENDLTLRVHVITPHILRLRYAVEGRFENDFSYGIDPKFKIEKTDVSIEETTTHLFLKTSEVNCRIDKASLSVGFLDNNGNLLNEDEKGFHWEPNEEYGNNIIQMTKKVMSGEVFYGLGDKPTDLNLKGRKFQNWGTDTYGYLKDSDPLYKNIPFYYGLHKEMAYGIFFDNSFKTYFDFAKERTDVMSFWAHGGEMNYYFIAGPQLMDVCQRYTMLTGTPEMPPMWALGFQQCKLSYYPESKVKEVANKFREYQIPCDAIYLDIDYMDGFRCFTWDNERFPDPKRMVDELKEQGFQTMVIIDPGIKIDKEYDVYKEGIENDYFCKWPDGGYVQGKVWPGECYFPDFTRPDVREWWAGLYKGLIQDVGVAGVWNDMNEPAVFEVEGQTFKPTVLFDYDGNQCSHRKAHNIYGMQMARATADGVKQFRDGKRTLIITRSGYSGLQRYSSVWTGDNIASWEHLWLADVQAQRLAISGVSFCGSDIGGFIEQPTGEMMVRWIQLGIFHPFCRVHSSGDHGDQEPWSFDDETLHLFKRFVELRYQLLPYIYTSFYQYHKTGVPMLRPIVFYDQQDIETTERDHEFLCGDHILVCPVIKEKVSSRKMYIPRGTWFNFWSNKKFEGGKEAQVNAPLDKIPMFIKAGAVLPMYPIQQYVGEQQFDVVTLKVYFKNGHESSSLFEDDKETYSYESGDYKYSSFELNGSENALHLKQSSEGEYQTSFDKYELNFIGIPFEVKEVIVDGANIETNNYQTIQVSANFKSLEIKG